MIQQDNSEEYKHKFEMASAMAELNLKEKEIKKTQGYGKAYVVSFLLAPIGIYYFIKYLFFVGGDKESVKAGVISLLLTIVSLSISFYLMAALFKQASPQDLNNLKSLTVPANQNELLQLYK